MSVIAGVDVGNATTEVVLVSGGTILTAGRVPTRGRKGSPDSLRGAAALLRRLERQAGYSVDEARIAPLRAVDTSVVTVPDAVPPRGRLRVLAAGVSTPGGTGACVGPPLLLSNSADPLVPAPAPAGSPLAAVVPAGSSVPPPVPAGSALVAVIPAGLRYDEAAARLRGLLGAGAPIGAVLVASDEGVLVANRLPSGLPVIDQVDAAAAAACELLAVEVQPPGHTLRLLADPVALAARLGLGEHEDRDAAALSRALADHSNAVVGLLAAAPAEPGAGGDEPWVLTADGRQVPLRSACASLADWPPGTVRVFGAGSRTTEVDDLFAVDLAAAAEAATARQGSTGRAVLVAALGRAPGPGVVPHADLFSEFAGVKVSSPLSEPTAARAGALTTPGARSGAVVVDLGAGTIDVIGPASDVVAAGAGELLTAAVAETLGIPRAAADWVKRGPCLRVDGGQRFEAEDGSRGFLPASAPASAVGMLVIDGPGGLLPFDRRHGPGEWRAIRLRLKQAVLARNFQRAVRTLGADPGQILVVGGPAGDEELLGVLARSLPDGTAVGRGDVGGTCPGEPLGHRYAVALGMALA
ncbi:MAG TPA: diol dehydratase reactivase ATPase-like domain-containing protein [Streptosporangiaceae bacterium]